jgi:hypothetical protein
MQVMSVEIGYCAALGVFARIVKYSFCFAKILFTDRQYLSVTNSKGRCVKLVCVGLLHY